MISPRQFTNIYQMPSISAEPKSDAEHVIHDTMLEAAGCEDSFRLNQLIQSRSSGLVAALEVIFETLEPSLPTRILKGLDKPAAADVKLRVGLARRLMWAGVRNGILDDLEISRLHMARAHRIMDTLEVSEYSLSAQQRLQDFNSARWEYIFGLTFLSLLASGVFQETAPGVDLMLGRMRHSSRNTYVHAAAIADFKVGS